MSPTPRPAGGAGALLPLALALLLAANLAPARAQDPTPEPPTPAAEAVRTADEDFLLAQELLSEQRHDEADVHLQLALHKNDLDPRFHHGLGRLRLFQRRYDEAVEGFSRALALNPRAIEYAQDLALAYQSRGDREGALRVLRDALEFHSRDERLWFQIGNLQDALGRPKEAIQAYVEATYRYPMYAAAYRALGRVYLEMGNRDKALLFTEQAARLNPMDLDATLLVGRLYATHRRDPARARDPLETVLRYRPDDLEAVQLLVRVYHGLDQDEPADEGRRRVWELAQTSRRVSVKPEDEYVVDERVLEDGRTVTAWAPIRYEPEREAPVRFEVRAPGGAEGEGPAEYRLAPAEAGGWRLAQTAPRARVVADFGAAPPGYAAVRESLLRLLKKEPVSAPAAEEGAEPGAKEGPRPGRRR